MANEEHLNLLRQGVDIWNEKRPDKPDLSGANLRWSWPIWSKRADRSKANLSWADLSDTNLSDTNLSNATLSNATLSNAKLSGADLSDANLSNANLSWAKLSDANLSNADLSNADLSNANLSGATLIEAKLSGANLSGATLIEAKLSGANLSGADLRGATLIEANLVVTILVGAKLSGAYLTEAKMSGAYLAGAYLDRAILGRAILVGANLRETNLRGANLSESDLRESNLSQTDLSEADLSRANLSGANFRASQALNTNFENANLTAACIEDWNINKETNLTNVICDYIYLKCAKSEENGKMIFTERRPSNPDENFAPGDFARLVQKTIETLDLIFRDGIEWKSFAVSLQELNQEAKIKIASENDPLSIRAIETRDDGSFVIRVNIPAELDKAEIEKSFKQKYSRVLKAREEYYRRELQAKDSQIQQLHREYKIDFKEMFATLAQVQANKIITYMSNNGDIYHINAPTGIAHSSGEIKGQAKIAGVLNEGQQNNLNMIKVEIDQILKPLLEQYPTNTTSEQMIVASQAIQQIENNPSLKARFINAAKEGSLAALEQSLNHPVCSFIINAVKGWQEA